jgi:hypothetical protein
LAVYPPGSSPSKKRIFGFWLCAVIILSSLIAINWNVGADSDNVYVDGYVYDSGMGTPIENATIILQNLGDGNLNATKTDATGYFNLSIFTPVTGALFTLSAFHDDYLVNSTDIFLFPWFNLTQDLYLDPALEKGSYVHGTIYDAVTKMPIAWQGIAAYSQTYINTTGANATGFYWMGLQSNQTYVFQVQKSGYETGRRSAYFRWGDNLSMDFLLEPTNCTLKGYIEDGLGPVGNSSVFVYRQGDPHPIEYRPQVNETTGYYELNLSRGIWQVEVEDDEHLSQTLTALVFSGNTTWQNFTLFPIPTQKATVQGYVRYYENQTGVAGGLVSASNLNGTWRHFNATNTTGGYNLSVIPGQVTITAYVSDHTSKSFIIDAVENEIYWVNHSVFDPAENAYLDGYVKVNGTGEQGVRVAAYHGWMIYEDQTDITGYYNISVPSAPLDVQAIKSGFKTAFSQVNTTSSQTSELNLTLEVLDWSSELRGCLNNSLGEPVESSYVSMDYDGLGYESSTTSTDYTGLYQGMVPSGPSSYFILPEENEYKVGVLDLPSDAITWFNSTLNYVDRSSKVNIRFSDMYTGEPIKHLKVTISEQDLQWYSEEETDSKGMISTTVPTGFVRFTFDAYSNGYVNPGPNSNPYNLHFLFTPKYTRWLNISLFPRDYTGSIYGYVNDSGNNPISDATVYAEHGDTVVSVLTNATGYYELSLPGNHRIDVWVRASGYKIKSMETSLGLDEKLHYDWSLDSSVAWIEGQVKDSGSDIDGDTAFDYLNIAVTVNASLAGSYLLEGELRRAKNDHSTISTALNISELIVGAQKVTLEFMGEQIWNSKESGYYVEIELTSALSLETLDKVEHFTSPYNYDDFDPPNAMIMTPVEQWLVDSDSDGLYNLLVINLTINATVAGEYVLMGLLRDIWGFEFDQEFVTLKLEIGLQKVQISFKGSSIYGNRENLGSCYLILFEELPQIGNEHIHTLFFFTPYRYDLFQSHNIDSFISGYVTDMYDQPIENMDVMLYNITYKYLNSTKTNDSGYYMLGGWGGDWILVVEDDEDEGNYQGNLSELSLSTGKMLSYDIRNLTYTLLDNVEEHITFSDWNNTYLDWQLYAVGDNETIRFMMDVVHFGDGDGFLSEEEAELIMEFIGGTSLPTNSSGYFTVDGIWFDLNLSSETFDVGIVGPVTSSDPVYIHMTGNYTSNSTIPNPGPHELVLNCSYDDTDPQSIAENNATYIYHIAVPTGWGRTGNGTTQNVTITGDDYITVDPFGDPDPLDSNISETVNITISSGISPTYCSIKGNVSLQGSGGQGGVLVTVYDNGTGLEVGSSPTDPNGYYEIIGLSPGTYDVVAHKSGYMDNSTFNRTIAAGEVLWLDFTLFSYPPTISHTPITTALVDNVIEIYADVTDDGKVKEVVLYYKDVGSSSYASTNMSRIASTSTFLGTIPAQSQTGYVYYYIRAEDTKGNNATHPAFGNHTIFIYELDPPEILNVTATPNPAEYPAPVNLTVEILDSNDIIVVSLFMEMPNSSTSNSSMDYDPNTGKYFVNGSYSLLGTYNFTIWANDTFDNWNSYSGSFQIVDTTSPSSYVEPLAQYWFSTSPITVSATAQDSGIGVSEVELWYYYSANGLAWSMPSLFGIDTLEPWSWSFDLTNEGYYRFFSIANDSEGNKEAMKFTEEAECGYDTSGPTSNVDVIDIYWHSATPVLINATAEDFHSGMASVRLRYRFSKDNSTWDSWKVFGTDTLSPWSWNFDFPDGEGFYEFNSRAVDILGNWESASTNPDTLCAYDISPAKISLFGAAPSPCELGLTINISAEISDISGVGDVRVHITLSGTFIGNYSMSHIAQDYWHLYTPDDVGTANIVLWAVDGNGFWNSTTTSVLVEDTTPPSIDDFLISPNSPEVEDEVKVSVNVTDFAGISSCRINITTPNGDWLLNETMSKASGTDTFSHQMDYDILGEYPILIWAVDSNGNSAVLEETVTTLDSSPPEAEAGLEQRVTVGTRVTLDAGLSSDNYGISNYTWSFNENGLKHLYGVKVNYTFNIVDDYKITLTVWDFGGNKDTSITYVNVTSVSLTGTISGTVFDENGKAVEGATVYLEGLPTKENITDSLGRYILHDVPIGSYRIIVAKEGYTRSTLDVNVSQDQTTSGDMVLAKSAAAEETPWALFGVVAAVIAVCVFLLLFFLLKKKEEAPKEETVIDEIFFMTTDGRLIKHFTRRLRPDMDEDILSGMLVAVQDFIKDSFKDREGVLDEMKFGKFQILLGRGKYILLATIVLGDELEPFKPQIAKCVQDIEEKFGNVLKDWDGEISKVMGASKYIMDLIEGGYA